MTLPIRGRAGTRRNSELPRQVARSRRPSVSTTLYLPPMATSGSSTSASATAASSPVSSRSRIRPKISSLSASPASVSWRRRRELGEELVAHAVAEALDEAVVGEQPAARHERRVAGHLGRRAGRLVADVGHEPVGLEPVERGDAVVVERHGRGAAVAEGVGDAVDVPADAPAVGVLAAAGLVPGVGALVEQRVRRAHDQVGDGHGCAPVGEGSAHVRRPGRSGSRRRSAGGSGSPSCGRWIARRRGSAAHEPPRSTW